MRINNWQPSPGALIDWDVAEILTLPSGDMTMCHSLQVCLKCRTSRTSYYDLVEVQGESAPCPRTSHEWENRYHFGDAETIALKWHHMLLMKREDDHYPHLLHLVEQEGIKMPLGAILKDGRPHLMNGHHRMAIAVDLGLTTVPVYFYANRDSVDFDS